MGEYRDVIHLVSKRVFANPIYLLLDRNNRLQFILFESNNVFKLSERNEEGFLVLKMDHRSSHFEQLIQLFRKI